jgi:UDP-N-acetylmuramyl pentapeptide phosphotransferase/UDP-N-acetylglucosamine-1-phosphate transferase
MGVYINAIDLLDLRPGRAGKGFTLAAVLLLMLGWPWLFHLETLFLLMVLGSLLAYLPWDLQTRAMMGDAGSNALGITLGMVSCWSLSEQGLVVYLLLLLAFQLWTEKYSLTEWIEKVPLLHFLDKLGRQ